MTRPDSVLPLKTTLAVLTKGSTFSPISPATPKSSSSFTPPSLPTRSHTDLDDVVDAHRRRVALTLGDIEKTLAGMSLDSPSANKAFCDNSYPLPRGLLDPTLIGKEMDVERRVLRPRPVRRPGQSHHHESDSGLGSSILSTKQKSTPNADSTPAKTGVKGSAVTRSAASSTSKNLPSLSARATNRVFEHTLKPLLADSSFKEFHPVLLECPRKIQSKQIVCLRDVEKTLLLTAQVSYPRNLLEGDGDANNAMKGVTKVPKLYLDFCLSTVQCIRATVVYLSETEQRRPKDVPYSSGYFIDLVDQIKQYAQQLADQKKAGASDPNIKEEVKLHGGIAVNGRPAELVRISGGKAISLATGEPVELDEETTSPIRFKRSASQQLADDDEIMRSMARRKKNAPPEEYAPKMCREPGCGKEFKRPCDLTKHEKTHSRPWKCPVPTCKYHEYGWPTEKEMDRHHNDKHSAAPPMYECLYKPCPYKSKRESNCKQHMEKAHGWTYVRTKANGGKKIDSNPSGSVTHATPQLTNMPTPPSDNGAFAGLATSPMEYTMPAYNNNIEFPTYVAQDQFQIQFPQELSLDYSPSAPSDHATPSSHSNVSGGSPFQSPYQDPGSDFTVYDDIYNANAQVQMQNPFSEKDAAQFLAFVTNAEFQTTKAAPVHFSPTGQGNTMLFTPSTLADYDESFDDFQNNAQMGADFCLFPANGVKQNSPAPLFGEIPSVAAGYSQPTSQELLPNDWRMNQYQGLGFSQN